MEFDSIAFFILSQNSEWFIQTEAGRRVSDSAVASRMMLVWFSPICSLYLSVSFGRIIIGSSFGIKKKWTSSCRGFPRKTIYNNQFQLSRRSKLITLFLSCIIFWAINLELMESSLEGKDRLSKCDSLFDYNAHLFQLNNCYLYKMWLLIMILYIN